MGFDLHSPLNHGKRIGMCLGLGAQPLDGAEGLLLAIVADEPPRRFGGEKDEDYERSLGDIKSATLKETRLNDRNTHGEDPL